MSSQGTGSKRETLLGSAAAKWLGLEATERGNVYVMRFAERHLGNPVVRALHGGVVGSVIEISSELELARLQPESRVELAASAVDYLRVTKDADLYARVEVVRVARRVAFLSVWCWQDDEDTPVAHGLCTLRLLANEQT